MISITYLTDETQAKRAVEFFRSAGATTAEYRRRGEVS